MRRLGEGGLADPARALASHLGDAQGVAFRQPDRHAVTADSAQRNAALGHDGRGVVWTTRAEARQARESRDARTDTAYRWSRSDQTPGALGIAVHEPGIQSPHHVGRRQLTDLGHERGAVRIALAEQTWPHREVVEQGGELLLDQWPLLLDDQNLLQPRRKASRALGLERPGHRDLVERQAEFRCEARVDPQLLERLAHVQVGLAGGHDSESPPRAVERDPVETVGAHEGLCGLEALLEQALFGVQRQVSPTNPESGLRSLVVFGKHDLHPLRTDRDGAGAVDGVGEALEAHPTAGVARERPAVKSEVQVVLDVRRIENRDPTVDERLLALVRDRRRACSGIVTCQHEYASVGRAARVVAVLQRVAGAVDARPLAIPDGEDAIVAGALVQAGLLRAPYRGGSQILVHPGLEADVALVEEGPRLPQCHVVGAERRAAVARDESGRVQAGSQVALALHQGQTHERLHAGQPDAARSKSVAVVQRIALSVTRWRIHHGGLRQEGATRIRSHGGERVSIPRRRGHGRLAQQEGRAVLGEVLLGSQIPSPAEWRWPGVVGFSRSQGRSARWRPWSGVR